MPAPVYAMFVGTDGRIRYVNNELVRLTGLSIDEIVGKRSGEIIKTPTGKTLADKILKTRKSVINFGGGCKRR